MLAADVASGIGLHRPGTMVVVTTSFSFRRTDLSVTDGDVVTAASTHLFEGRSRVVDSVAFTGGAGHAVGHGQISFAVRSGTGHPDDRPDERASGRFLARRSAPITTPLAAAAGITTVDAAGGHVHLSPGPPVMRNGHMVQGSFVTLMGEMAALAMAGHVLDRPAVVTALDARYLRPVRGPAATSGRWLGAPGVADVEIMLRDCDSDAVCATYIVRVAAG